MEPSIKAAWWLWWGNPLVQMHPDQKKRFQVSKSSEDQLDYSDIEMLRSTLCLGLIPDAGVVTPPYYGALVMLEPLDLIESKQKLPALSFDESVFTYSQAQWAERFNIDDKDYIRALMTFSRNVPDELKPFVKRLTDACNEHTRVGTLTLIERTQIAIALFCANQFPVFYQRWVLNLSDSVLYVIDKLRGSHPELEHKFCTYIQPEIQRLVDQICQRFTIPELDFKTLADFESQAS